MQFTNTFNFEISAPVACFLEVFSHHICYLGSFIGWSEVLQERKDREIINAESAEKTVKLGVIKGEP